MKLPSLTFEDFRCCLACESMVFLTKPRQKKSKGSGVTIPYKSEKQRKYLNSEKPEVAAKFNKHTKKKAAKKAASKKGGKK